MGNLQLTIEALAKSRNEAATPALMAALEATQGDEFLGVVRALTTRRSKAGHLAVLKKWHALTPQARKLVDESQGRMGGALREALLSSDDRLFLNACEVAHESGEFDLAPTLLTVAEQADGPRPRAAAQLLVEMVDRLRALSSGVETTGYTRHPETIRRSVLESFERSIERFGSHGRVELVEGFVILAGAESATLRGVFESKHHACHQAVVDVASTSVHPGVLTVLTSYLASYEAPAAVRSIIGKRGDRAFVDALLAVTVDEQNHPLQKNLSRMKSIGCLEAIDAVATRLEPEQQATAMWLVARCGAAEEFKLDLAERMLARGSQAGRLAACVALERFTGQRANALVLAALADPTGQVQSAATRQLRDRHIPGTMGKLIDLLDSPHAEVQQAARESLADFSFDDYAGRYETMDDESRRTNGALVARVDATTPKRLREEMSSLVRRHRLRAIEMAGLMGMLSRVADALVERLGDEDHMVRAAAAEALQNCTGLDVRNALIDALDDRSHAVQSAARASLKNLGCDVGVAGGAREGWS